MPDLTEVRWAAWVLDRRLGEEFGYANTVHTQIEAMADRVLDARGVSAGMTLLDIGAGEGLLGWRVIERIGPSLRVILSDISEPLLPHARSAAVQRGVEAQCSFTLCGAEELVGVPNASVDVVTSRAALGHFADKRVALREVWRELEPGGWLAIAEPMFRNEATKRVALRKLLDAQSPEGCDPFMARLLRRRSAQFRETDGKLAANPLTNYSERDFAPDAQACGFEDFHLQLPIDVEPSDVPSWETIARLSPHRWAVSLGAMVT